MCRLCDEIQTRIELGSEPSRIERMHIALVGERGLTTSEVTTMLTLKMSLARTRGARKRLRKLADEYMELLFEARELLLGG